MPITCYFTIMLFIDRMETDLIVRMSHSKKKFSYVVGRSNSQAKYLFYCLSKHIYNIVFIEPQC